MLLISNDESVDVGDRILTAAASCVRDFGSHRVTLAEIARRAGVSRPTVYRRWPDTATILAALLTDRITGAWREVPMRGTGRDALVQRITAVAGRLRRDELIRTVLRSAPELAMVYISAAQQRSPSGSPAAGSHGSVDRSVDNPVRPDCRTYPGFGCPWRRTRPYIEWIPVPVSYPPVSYSHA